MGSGSSDSVGFSCPCEGEGLLDADVEGLLDADGVGLPDADALGEGSSVSSGSSLGFTECEGDEDGFAECEGFSLSLGDGL